jgi:hypothetical protein
MTETKDVILPQAEEDDLSDVTFSVTPPPSDEIVARIAAEMSGLRAPVVVDWEKIEADRIRGIEMLRQHQRELRLAKERDEEAALAAKAAEERRQHQKESAKGISERSEAMERRAGAERERKRIRELEAALVTTARHADQTRRRVLQNEAMAAHREKVAAMHRFFGSLGFDP